MSYKYQAVPVSPNHYVLPRFGDMKVEVHAYLSEALHAASEENMWNQAVAGASYEGVTGAYLMPDAHSGFGVPIGSVLVTEGTIIQASVGFDVGCGVLCMQVPLSVGQLKNRYPRERWIAEVEKRVATGLGSRRPDGMRSFSAAQVDEVLLYGAEALGVQANACERLRLPVPKELDLKKIEKAYLKASPQLGSLGSSNHFLELQAADDGSVWIMVHCGSRGFGYQVAEHFFYEAARERGIPSKQRGLAWLRADEPLGREYWAFHNAAANYAVANRFAIAAAVAEATEEAFRVTPAVFYDISHNLIQEETLVLPDGSTRRGLVHRKGATRAMPAGHPDLRGTRWEATGHPVLVPGSMYSGAAIMQPRPGAHATACSVNHGSGRLMARGDAKRRLGHKQDFIDGEMREVRRTFGGTPVEGIVTNHRHVPLDECGRVYKDLDEVLAVLVAEDVASVTTRMWPVANLKGQD